METHRHPDDPIVVGFQGKAQLEVIYGHLAEVMLSQPATSIYLKTEEPNARERVSKAIGKVEIESLKEAHFDGGRGFSMEEIAAPLMQPSSKAKENGDHSAQVTAGNAMAAYERQRYRSRA